MSNFFVKQKIGKNIYIYEVTSYWDTQNKTTKQKRRYIGKLTDTGEIITPKKSVYPLFAKHFGATYLFEELSKKIGLYDLLDKIFHDKVEDILNLSIFFAIERKNINAYFDYIKSTHTTFRCNLINPNSIISLLKDLSSHQTQLVEFLKLWQEKQIQSSKNVYIDIKLYFSKSIDKKLFYEADKDLSFAYRIGIILSQENYMPLNYYLYSNKLIVADDIKRFISENVIFWPKIFILESDFSNYYDINLLNSLGIKFIMPNNILNSNVPSKAFKDSLKISDYDDTNYIVANSISNLYNTKLRIHVYLNEKEKLEKVDNFIKSLSELESLIKLKIFHNAEEVKMFMDTKLNNSSKYYDISVINKKAIIKKKQWVISHKLNKIAKVLLVTNDLELNDSETLSTYSIRYNIENFFDLIISDIGEYNLFVKSKQIFEGRLFIQFISFILFSAFQNTLKSHESFKEYTSEQILSELKNLQIITLSNNKKALSEKNKLQKDLFDLFNIEVPISV